MGTGRYGGELEQTHPEEGLKIPWKEDPCLFRKKKKWRRRGFFEKAKGIWAPREKFSSLRGAWICGGRERVL